ncbi:MAG TPA: T9SS type A sorting domain-containing protein [Saprospiraceae bacterium]|nr:T9SS type A sorting domain-containing protein [Saprospiraceae bacterium]
MKILLSLFLTFYFSSLNAAVVPKPGSMYFIENKGQMMYQDGSHADDIRYCLISGDMRIDIKSNSIHYTLYQKTYLEADKVIEPLKKGKAGKEELASCASYRVDVLLEGSNIGNEIIPSGKLDYYENYYLTGCGVDGVTHVSAFSSLLIKDIYPGIDWKIYIDGDRFKYDFIVYPGADPAMIKLKYLGAESILKDQYGNIDVRTPYGNFTENKPYSYDATTKTEIPSEYKIDENALSFKIDAYSGTCIIDPVIEWCTYYGGSLEDWISMTQEDEGNNVMMVGLTSSRNNIATTGAHQFYYKGGTYDGLLVYFDSKGSRKWSTYYGGNGADEFYSVQYYEQEFILLGLTSSLYDISSPNTYQTDYGGGETDCFLAKFDKEGLRLWSTYYGGLLEDGSYPDYPTEGFLNLKVDNSGTIYIAGTTSSLSGIATVGSYSSSYNGGISDCFLVKFDNNGSRIWGTYLGGAEDEQIGQIDIDNENNVVICGDTRSTDGISTPDTYQAKLSGDYDSFIMKFDPDGARSWGTYFGGPKLENGNNMKVDKENNIYLLGSTTSTQTIATAGAYQTLSGGNFDGFLEKFSPDGKRIWGTFIGGWGNEYFFGLDIDIDGNIVFSGMTTTAFPKVVKGNAIQSTFGGGDFDCVIEKFDKNGKQLWGSYFGSNGNDRSWTLDIDLVGDIYVGGGTSSKSNIATSKAHQTKFGGGLGDVLLLKISDESLKNDEITENSFSGIYPNPTSGILQFTGYPELNQLTINVYNYSGIPVSAKIKDNALDISALIPGIYLIQIIDGKNKSAVTKVVKI